MVLPSDSVPAIHFTPPPNHPGLTGWANVYELVALIPSREPLKNSRHVPAPRGLSMLTFWIFVHDEIGSDSIAELRLK